MRPWEARRGVLCWLSWRQEKWKNSSPLMGKVQSLRSTSRLKAPKKGRCAGPGPQVEEHGIPSAGILGKPMSPDETLENLVNPGSSCWVTGLQTSQIWTQIICPLSLWLFVSHLLVQDWTEGLGHEGKGSTAKLSPSYFTQYIVLNYILLYDIMFYLTHLPHQHWHRNHWQSQQA